MINLCYFYSCVEPYYTKFPNLFDDIRKVVLNSENPEEATKFLMELSNSANKIKKPTLINDINRFLLDLFYEIGLYQKAYSIFEKVKFNQGEVQILYKAMLLNRIGEHINSLKILKKAPKIYYHNNRFRLCAGIITLICNAGLNRYPTCEKIYDEMIKEEKFRNYHEYGYLLRNSILACSLSDTVNYLKSSIEFFENKNEFVEMGHSCISIMITYCRLGNFKSAMIYQQKAEKSLLNRTLERHILLNNNAALCMRQNIYDDNVKQNLLMAKHIANYNFDKIVILRNLLLYYIHNKEKNEYKGECCEDIIEQLLKLIKNEKNEMCICNTFLQISYYYKKTGDNNQFLMYHDKYINMHRALYHRGLRKGIVEAQELRCQKEFSIGYLSFWHYKIQDFI